MQKEWKKLGQLCYTRPGITPKMQTRFEETGMYKNIIFDFGGVMVDFDPKEYLVDRFCNAETEELVSQLTFESEEWKLLDAGLLSRYEANQRMLTRAKEHDCVFEVQGVLDDWMHILRPRRKMQELVQKLKAHGYCVYYLSNIPEDVLALLMERDFRACLTVVSPPVKSMSTSRTPAFIRHCWTNTASRPARVFSSTTARITCRPPLSSALSASG